MGTSHCLPLRGDGCKWMLSKKGGEEEEEQQQLRVISLRH